MNDLDDWERDNWTRPAPMTKQEKLEQIRKMRAWLATWIVERDQV